jgi:hypothetical protein
VEPVTHRPTDAAVVARRAAATVRAAARADDGILRLVAEATR